MGLAGRGRGVGSHSLPSLVSLDFAFSCVQMKGGQRMD